MLISPEVKVTELRNFPGVFFKCVLTTNEKMRCLTLNCTVLEIACINLVYTVLYNRDSHRGQCFCINIIMPSYICSMFRNADVSG